MGNAKTWVTRWNSGIVIAFYFFFICCFSLWFYSWFYPPDSSPLSHNSYRFFPPKSHEARQLYLFKRQGVDKRAVPSSFCIHELTETHDWLVSVWLIEDREYSIPFSLNKKFKSQHVQIYIYIFERAGIWTLYSVCTCLCGAISSKVVPLLAKPLHETEGIFHTAQHVQRE